MSKIICDICGTAYPETSTQCPICGCVRPAETDGLVSADTENGNARNYTYVKGGRFSKSNVKKRNRATQSADHSAHTAANVSSRQRTEQPKKKKKNTGFIVVSIILLLLVLAFVVFLTIKLFWPDMSNGDVQDTTPAHVQTEPSEKLIACESLHIDVNEVLLNEAGSARMIYVTPHPADTTDPVIYSSSDESVATVTQNGKVTAVGPGEAKILITCGGAENMCNVICDFEAETQATEESTEEETEDTTISLEDFRLNREDITFSYKGEKWILYSGSIDVTLINWTSDNTNVARIENGVVEAVGVGTTEVHGEIDGVMVSCIIRCSFSETGYEDVGGNGGIGEDS